jgi:beta-glucosidase
MHEREWCAGSLAIAALMACTASAGCSDGHSGKAKEHGATFDGGKDDAVDSGDAGAGLEAKVEVLVASLTRDEKLSLMAGTGTQTEGLWPTPGVPRLGLAGYLMTDGARGVGATQSSTDRTQKATAFPVGSARGATFDTALEERVGEAIGMEARAWGANVILAPVVNVLRHPAWGRSQETYGEDPLHLGVMGAAFVRGAQHHVLANAKHYALNDIEDTRFNVDVTVDERTLREVFLAPFRAVVAAGVGSIMSAYNQVNGSYCSENAHLLGILENEWNFNGFVESDWIAAVRSTAPSVSAGLDIEMPTASYFTTAKLAAALDDGTLAGGQIDDAVRRIVRKQLELPTMIDPAVPALDVVGNAAHGALALDAAREGIVLLKNDSNALPLDRKKVRRVAVVGTFAGIARLGDAGSSNVVPGHAVTPLDGLRDRAPSLSLDVLDTDTLGDADGVTVARADAAVVVVGLTAIDEGENVSLTGTPGDRKTLALHPEHVALIQSVAKLNPRTIVVIEAGSAITMTGWNDLVPAIAMAWYPGQEGGNAIADVLFGDVNPSGRLPVSFPVSESDLPPFDDVSNAVTYGYLHGYRYLDANGTTPLFPFGFGLSYTTFAFTDLVLSSSSVTSTGSLSATVQVENTGAVVGDEVVELYVGTTGTAVPRAPRVLAVFSRVHLEPGKSATVSLPLSASDLAYYEVTSSSWKVEPGTYTISVGSSSRDLPLSADLAVR